PLEVGPASDQAAALVAERRELDLELAFPGPCALAEDLEDEAGAVDDLAFPGALEVALLDRRERPIHHHELDRFRLDERAEALNLAAADQGRRPRLGDPDRFRMDDGEADGERKARSLGKARLRIAR